MTADYSLSRRTDPGTHPSPAVWYAPMCGAVGVFAFVFNWATGHRGIYLLDQSMIFDGAWRILQGQVPYKDFLVPFGPVTFLVQAIFFRLFGVNWSAMVLAACLFNVLATLSVIRIIRLLTGGCRGLAIFGGLATAICFQAPFGTLWLEQTAMLFDVLALQAAVESRSASGRGRHYFQVMTGASLSIAFLSKQNYALFFIPVVLILMLAVELPDLRASSRAVLLTVAGMATTMALFLCWVWLFSDLSSFILRFFVVGGEIGRSRLSVSFLVRALFFEMVPSFQMAPNWSQIDLIAVVSGGIGLFFAVSNNWGEVWRDIAPASTCALLLPWFRSFAEVTTLNEWQNSFGFVGLAVCLGIGVLLKLSRYIPITSGSGRVTFPAFHTVKMCAAVPVAAWAAVVLLSEGRDAWQRTVQQFGANHTFRDTLSVRGLERVRWGEPTVIDQTTTVKKVDLERVVSYLKAKKSTFFVMGDSTLLYGLVGKRSPQPLLYFVPSHSFLPREVPVLDPIIQASLVKNDVRLVVREKALFLAAHYPGVAGMYQQFPRTWAWFTNDFAQVAEFGNYQIWERKPEPSTSAYSRGEH